MTVTIKKVKQPLLDHGDKKVFLTDATISERKEKVLSLMTEHGFSSLAIYADKEHGSNFEYLTGFIPRFEEGLLVLNKNGQSTLLLGNENYNKTKYSRISSEGVLCPLFSLSNQPMDLNKPFKKYLEEVDLDKSEKVGLVGWKILSAEYTEFVQDYDVPAFIVEGLEETVGAERLVNATQLLTEPSEGARATNNANEIAFYEYGASLASDGVLEAMNQLKPGMKEVEAGEILTKKGQYNTVVTIAAFGERFEGANLYPTERVLKEGDKVSLTVSNKGGLTSRVGYAVRNEEELAVADQHYLEEAVIPYYEAYNYWLEQIKIGAIGGEFYDQFNQFYPQATYGWNLCPGHLVSDEEWMSSPFYAGSKKEIKSGMLFQLDFIPIQPGHQGVSAESTLALADQELRSKIEQDYPALWQRIVQRRAYMKEELGIDLNEEILPMGSTLGYLRPFLLDSNYALALTK